MEIMEYRQEGNEIGIRSYIPSPFILAALPVKNNHKPVFQRKFNDITMSLTGIPQVPYGKFGRYVLTLLTTRCKLAEIEEGQSLEINFKSTQEILNELQLEERRDGQKVREQIEYFAKTTFVFEQRVTKEIQKSLFEEFRNEKGNFLMEKVSYGNIPFMDYCSYIDIKENGEKKKCIEVKLVMNEKFVKLCKNHSVPIDYKIYKGISAPLEKDLYAWIIYRNNFMKEGVPLYVTKNQLVDQFLPVSENADKGAQTNTNYSLIKEYILNIKNNWYKELKVDFDASGLVMYKSPSVISENDKRYILSARGLI